MAKLAGVRVEHMTARTGLLRRAAQISKHRFQQFFASEMPAWAFFLDFVVYPPLILLGLYMALVGVDAAQFGLSVVLVLAGVAIWTLAEYLIHRFAFHHAPVLKPIHLAHHDAPRGLNGTPTIITVLVFYLLIYWPASHLMAAPSAAALTAGLMAGYLAYVAVHYIVHHMGSGGSKALRRLIKLHAMHHHNSAHNFGVTSAFWDRVFGTLERR